MIIENPNRLIRELKGAPISCFLALCFAKQPVGTSFLVSVTGYEIKAVSMALRYLREVGLATSTGRYNAWHLTTGVQLPIPIDGQLSGGAESAPPDATTTINFKLEESYERNSSSSTPRCGFRTSHENDPVYQLLMAAGIGEPKRSELCGYEWMTEEYVISHIEHAKANKTPPGLLIWKMENHDPEPELPEDPNAPDKYTKGYEWLFNKED